MNKTTIDRYMDGFRRTDRAQILSCLTTPTFPEQIVPGAVKITIGEGQQKAQDIKLGI